jgi:hypothetical protein
MNSDNNNNDLIVGLVYEFIETCVHTLLRYRKIYPDSIFEQRSKYGISVFQSRHPDVNHYIRKVLDNSRQLLERGLLDSYIFTTYDNKGNVIDQVVISLKIKALNKLTSSSSSSSSSSGKFTTQQLYCLEEEFRSFILRLTLLDTSLVKLPDDCTWLIMIETIPDASEIMQSTLTTGDWLIDNNMSPLSRNNDTNGTTFMIKPIKSFQSDQMNISINAYTTQKQ